MTITTAIAIYFLIWWVMLFTVLPWGVRSQEEQGDVASGTDPGAPSIPHLGRKLVWTTVVSAAVFAVYFGVHQSGWITINDLASGFGLLGPRGS